MQSYLLRCSHGLSAYGKCQSRIHRIIVVCGRPDGWNMNFTIGDRSDGNVKLQDSQADQNAKAWIEYRGVWYFKPSETYPVSPMGSSLDVASTIVLSTPKIQYMTVT